MTMMMNNPACRQLVTSAAPRRGGTCGGGSCVRRGTRWSSSTTKRQQEQLRQQQLKQQRPRRRFMSVSNSSNHNQRYDHPSLRRRKISSTSTTTKSATSASEIAAAWRLPKRSLPTATTSKSSSSTTSSSLQLGPTGWLITSIHNSLLKFDKTSIYGNLGYLALASGFLCTDMLELRVLLVGGYSGLVTYHSLQPKPLKIPLYGSAFFVLVNAIAATMLVADRYAPASLNSSQHPDGEELYKEHFEGLLTRGQFHQLLDLSTRQKLPQGTILTRENHVCDKIYFIVKGQAHIYHGLPTTMTSSASEDDNSSNNNNNITITAKSSSSSSFMTSRLLRRMLTSPNPAVMVGPNIATIEQGGFVNDVAFNCGGKDVGAYGTVIVSSGGTQANDSSDDDDDDMDDDMDMDMDSSAAVTSASGSNAGGYYTEVLMWDTAELQQHLASRPDMERAMKYCMSDHLVKSLLRQREAAHRRQHQHQHIEQQQTLGVSPSPSLS